MIIFADSIERANTVTVDGYSDRKTISGAVKDFGRYIEKTYHNGEGNAIIDIVKDGISETNSPFASPKGSDGGYFFEIEKVPCASRYRKSACRFISASFFCFCGISLPIF